MAIAGNNVQCTGRNSQGNTINNGEVIIGRSQARRVNNRVVSGPTQLTAYGQAALCLRVSEYGVLLDKNGKVLGRCQWIPRSAYRSRLRYWIACEIPG